MRFLVDECLSTQLGPLLAASGHDVVHVLEAGLQGMTDEVIMAWCRSTDRVLLTADTDFGGLLWLSNDPLPSVILLRRRSRFPSGQAAVILANIGEVDEDLALGSLVVFTDNLIRVRRLPISGSNSS